MDWRLQKFLIVDSSEESQEHFKEKLEELGIYGDQVISCSQINEALVILEQEKIHVVISEVYLQDGSGFELYQKVKEKYQLIFFLACVDYSPVLVSQAAEEEVSAYLLKPCRGDILKSLLIDSAKRFYGQDEFYNLINQAQKKINENQLDRAFEILEQASLHKAKSALVFWMQAQIYQKKEELDLFLKKIKQALQMNPYHLKSLHSLLQYYQQMGDRKQAFVVMKKMTSLYPANEQRLCQAFHTSIYLNQFQEIKGFYDVYRKMVFKSEEIKKYVRASLYILSKHYILKGERESALLWARETLRNTQETQVFFQKFVQLVNRYWSQEMALEFSQQLSFNCETDLLIAQQTPG